MSNNKLPTSAEILTYEPVLEGQEAPPRTISQMRAGYYAGLMLGFCLPGAFQLGLPLERGLILETLAWLVSAVLLIANPRTSNAGIGFAIGVPLAIAISFAAVVLYAFFTGGFC